MERNKLINLMNNNELDEKRIAQIRRELENYSTEQLTEIWRRHDLDEWTEEAFAAIRQILAARPAVQLPAQDELALSGDYLERAYQSGEAGRVQEALGELELAIRENPELARGLPIPRQSAGRPGRPGRGDPGVPQSALYQPQRRIDPPDLRRTLSKQFQQVALKRQSAEDAKTLDGEESDEMEDEVAEEDKEEAASQC